MAQKCYILDMNNEEVLLVCTTQVGENESTELISDDPYDYVQLYAHGQLEDSLGFDILDILSGAKVVDEACRACSSIPVKVRGIGAPCTMYAWNAPWCGHYRKIGLVVIDTDKEYVDDAMKKQSRRNSTV